MEIYEYDEDGGINFCEELREWLADNGWEETAYSWRRGFDDCTVNLSDVDESGNFDISFETFHSTAIYGFSAPSMEDVQDALDELEEEVEKLKGE